MDLKAWRRANGFSQARVAQILGVHVNTVANWEHSGKPLPLEWQQKLGVAGASAEEVPVCYSTHPQLYNVVRQGRNKTWYRKLAHPQWWWDWVTPTEPCYPKDLLTYVPTTPEVALQTMVQRFGMSKGAAYNWLLNEMGETITLESDPEAVAALHAFMNGLAPPKKKDNL